MSLAVAPSIQPAPPAPGRPIHRTRLLYIDSGPEAVVYLHRQSDVCRSEGFERRPATGTPQRRWHEMT
jgi:hypothetical protein